VLKEQEIDTLALWMFSVRNDVEEMLCWGELRTSDEMKKRGRVAENENRMSTKSERKRRVQAWGWHALKPNT